MKKLIVENSLDPHLPMLQLVKRRLIPLNMILLTVTTVVHLSIFIGDLVEVTFIVLKNPLVNIVIFLKAL